MIPPIDTAAHHVSPIRKAAEQLEATFLAEMLKSAGLYEMPDAFNGGAGEGQFASEMRRLQAEAMVKGGGIGLAEQIVRSLAEQPHGQ